MALPRTAKALFLLALHVSAASCRILNSSSSLTILLQNDLLGSLSDSGEATILTDTASYQEASQKCSEIQESLINLEEIKSSFNLSAVLGHLTYDGPLDNDQLYWVASGPGNCQATNAEGKIRVVSCLKQLPGLCTQNAPFSNVSYADTSSKWQVTVQSGAQNITGFRDRASFRFLGVRYASQPERFTYAQTFAGPSNQSALAFGQECIQLPGAGGEDCLFLNIFTSYLPGENAAGNPNQLRAVMFYLHGGAFLVGSGADPEYDGGNLASRGDVVVVTINYRLGIFGFLALDDNSTNGNYGIADQIIALDWVRANIAAFGGDPDRITVFGQSAGANSVRALLGSPQAIGKFAAAMPLSHVAGLGILGSFYTTYPTIADAASSTFDVVLAPTNCSSAKSQVDCLRGFEPQDLLFLTAGMTPYVVQDGTYVNTPYLILNGSGHVANVHLTLGVMRDDAAALIPYPTTTNITQAIEEAGISPDFYINNTGLFPEPSGANATLDVFNVTAHMATDGELRCLDEAIAVAGVRNNIFKSVWFYEYTRSYQPLSFAVNTPVCQAPTDAGHPYGDTSMPYFRCHAGDVYYTFGNLIRQGQPQRDDIDLPFSQLIVDLYTSFARSYTPNPSLEYLRVRDYDSTLQQIDRPGGCWEPVERGENPTLRRLDWPSSQAVFNEVAQCNALGLPLDYFTD
ncbi:hypothetical protein OIDMADRAFT_132746 [Oidiodendron maius Zn]|uniref:Carboxylic ester hydrolase n=1 Tax=Oidiodendron maius (strain Zn) TaxID=913774 RepID=A0A0C3CAU8_OIDMZ|nr:hypothetical protein OIDMADRAFT_132746 [Oidiodendron maius Zn]